ncbi:hypothetical protein [Gynuella sunshinyii]|uniref:ABC-type amino acid transport/signal transduction system, periplasmic component/domain n=1 Tax=Gynuella sunshinyii YC6258 TaxID=1445510 RepID=A0A0C5VE30_9GAMM|nr:hypothetical protein [Gynuella sunshinyii]AJQ92471.1 hypothetical Protein YC6258_00421 [Gynuella sunshinyii YC6258]
MRYVMALWLLLTLQSLALAQSDVVYYLAPETDSDPRQVYPLQLLRLALNKVDPRIQLKPSPFQMTQSRALTELIDDNAIDVVWSATSRSREQIWLPVRIPIYKGLLGYRVFLYKPDALTQTPAELSLEQLKQIPMIQGHDWPDTKILEANGFTTLSTANYDATFRMLNQQPGRLYPRSVTEVWNEWQMYRQQGIEIEPTLMLHYTMPQYFFVSKSNPELQ